MNPQQGERDKKKKILKAKGKAKHHRIIAAAAAVFSREKESHKLCINRSRFGYSQQWNVLERIWNRKTRQCSFASRLFLLLASCKCASLLLPNFNSVLPTPLPPPLVVAISNSLLLCVYAPITRRGKRTTTSAICCSIRDALRCAVHRGY